MDYETDEFNEGLPDIEALAIVAVDASGTMGGIELTTGERKHRRAAWMIQALLNALDDPQFANVFITVICFSASRNGVQIVSLLDCHNPYEQKTFTGNTDLDPWDGLSPQNCAQGMGGWTPIGTALAWARQQAEQWVNASGGETQRRVVIYLLSDGQNTAGPDGMEEKTAIQAFNASCEKGQIRLATIGYFQSAEGTNPEEDAGRKLLRALQLNEDVYFESNNIEKIVPYILATTTQV